MEAMRLVKDYSDRFIAFCSVHPHDNEMREKIFKYKERGFKGLKLKITDMELKNDFKPLVGLLILMKLIMLVNWHVMKRLSKTLIRQKNKPMVIR